MTRDAFRELVEEAIDTIPAKFAKRARNVVIVIEDAPSQELMREMEIDDPRDLLGLYQGTPLTERGSSYGNQLPDRITLFQHSIEDEAEGDDDEVVVAIGETLIHELGHYFGMTEEQIMDVEDRYWHGDDFPPELEVDDEDPDEGA